MEPLLRAFNLSQSLGSLSMVREMSLEIYPGEVLGVAGQSGAGKSTLAMVLAGVICPASGELYFDNRRLTWPFQARRLGIEVIHQQPEMAEGLSITRNVFLGHELGWSLFGRWLRVPDHRRMDAEAGRILAQLGMRAGNVHASVTHLSIEQRQLIAIARAMTHPARLIVIDDPGLLLSYVYQQKVLSLIQEWQQRGTAVLFASDNVDQLMTVADRILVLRHGRCTAEYQAATASREEILAAMVGAADQQQLTPFIWAFDSYYRAREQAEKLYQRQALLERELEGQDAHNLQLIDQLADQINALDRANTALQDAQRRLLTELEQERKRLAREIHDQVIQDLLGVGYQLEELEADGAGDAPNSLYGEEIKEIRSNVRDVVRELREICGTLRPPTIDSLGLGSALQSYIYDWSKRTGIRVTLQLDPDLGRLGESTELSIFRIVQEGLNNVRKHAAAHNAEIRLEYTSPRRLMLSIADDGRGLPADFDLSRLSSEGHYGVLGITERVALLGGQWRIQNRPEGGALIQVEIPERSHEGLLGG
jgi:signal transduction histidine kinase